MTSLIDAILINATKDAEMKPIEHNRRQHLVTPIIVIDDVERYAVSRYSGLHLKEVGELDFWNEISGWFHANVNAEIPHPVYVSDYALDVEIPSDIETRRWDGDLGSLTSPIVSGAYVVDRNYKLYQIYGWVNCDGSSEIYFDFI